MPSDVDPFAHRGEIPVPPERSGAAKVMEHGSRAVRRAFAFGTKQGHYRRRHRFNQLGIPLPDQSTATKLHAAVDELIVGGFQVFTTNPDADAWRRIEIETAEALGLFEERGWLDDPRSYHHDPGVPVDAEIRDKRIVGFACESLSFTSGWEPEPGEPGRNRWLAAEANRRARVILLRHNDGPRPWVVQIHGAQMGRAPVDARMLRAEHLHHNLGLNVAMPVLPMHGPRQAPKDMPLAFPNLDLVDNVHGLAQCVWDVRRLLAWIRTQEPMAIGLHGFSLGGYTTALVSGFEPELDCVIAGSPAVDFPTLFRRNMPAAVREMPRFEALMVDAEQLHRPVSPLVVRTQIPADRRFIYGGVADRLAHPIHQVGRLWESWDRSEVEWFQAGHIGHGLGGDVGRYIDSILGRHLHVAVPDPVPTPELELA